MSPGSSDFSISCPRPTASRRIDSDSGWMGGVLPLCSTFLRSPTSRRASGETSAVRSVRAIQQTPAASAAARLAGIPRRDAPAVVYRQTQPERSVVASDQTIGRRSAGIGGAPSCGAWPVAPASPVLKSLIPRHSGYREHDQNWPPRFRPRRAVLAIMGEPQSGQSGASPGGGESAASPLIAGALRS